MPASVFRVPFPATSRRTGTEPVGNLKMSKIKHYCIKAFHIHFVSSALSCALPAFLLFFLH
ncbi:unnamed protein product [Staurois parvus]|uniref:Succinate dehydrogenase subunit 4 n=1 Tax=Staurois parvus TaxID=386267 RepID=A0ABN9C7L4_9NEOB|nr:unnamed protein product [Staurois parvus]